MGREAFREAVRREAFREAVRRRAVRGHTRRTVRRSASAILHVALFLVLQERRKGPPYDIRKFLPHDDRPVALYRRVFNVLLFESPVRIYAPLLWRFEDRHDKFMLQQERVKVVSP